MLRVYERHVMWVHVDARLHPHGYSIARVHSELPSSLGDALERDELSHIAA